jgi:hypothetical protein
LYFGHFSYLGNLSNFGSLLLLLALLIILSNDLLTISILNRIKHKKVVVEALVLLWDSL